MTRKRKSWGNENRRRVREPGKPGDIVIFAVRMRRKDHDDFQAAVNSDPKWSLSGMGPLVRELIGRWMERREK